MRGVAYSTNPLLRGDRPILLVVHESNGDWQFLDGGPYNPDDDFVAVHVAHVFQEHPALRPLAGLPVGWAAERASQEAEWERSPWVDEWAEDE